MKLVGSMYGKSEKYRQRGCMGLFLPFKIGVGV